MAVPAGPKENRHNIHNSSLWEAGIWAPFSCYIPIMFILSVTGTAYNGNIYDSNIKKATDLCQGRSLQVSEGGYHKSCLRRSAIAVSCLGELTV